VLLGSPIKEYRSELCNFKPWAKRTGTLSNILIHKNQFLTILNLTRKSHQMVFVDLAAAGKKSMIAWQQIDWRQQKQQKRASNMATRSSNRIDTYQTRHKLLDFSSNIQQKQTQVKDTKNHVTVFKTIRLPIMQYKSGLRFWKNARLWYRYT